jgi:putative peptide zinc metalloprotease protein
MATLADSLVSSASRPLNLRMRSDLSARRHFYQGHPFFVVKEPVGLKYFRFQEEEYAILRMLDGRSSLEDIKEQFEEEYRPQKLTLPDLQQFIGTLHRSGLVIGDAPGQGRQLKKRRDDQVWKKRWAAMSNVFALRWRGIDPERLLNWLYKYTAWMFAPPVVIACCLLGLSALLLLGIQFDVFRARLPAFHEFFGPRNWIWLGLTLGIVKVLHEFGHGLSCKHFGGECHEMGFMLLVLTPCLYCNVSDSWMLPNKWRRAAIGAAGMYVELVLASVATFLWWFSEPGLLNHICLSVMFICSVSTVLFNGNPLLRFDGYYILADIVEIPNLRQKSTEVLRRWVFDWCLGLEQPEDPFLPRRNQLFMAMYTIAAVVYRWVIVLSIVMFLTQVFEPYGLKIIGQAIGLVGLFGLIVQPVWQLAKFFHVPGRMHEVKRHRVIATLAIIGALIAAVIYIPLPHYVRSALEVAPEGAASVFVDVPGKLDKVLVEPGQHVDAGQPLATLINIDLDLTIAELQGRRDEAQVQLTSLEQQQVYDLRASQQIPQVRETLAYLEQQLKEKDEQRKRLVLLAPQSGTVFPPPARPARRDPNGTLPTWSDTPLNDRNKGAMLAPGDLFCRIGDPAKLEAVLVIDQTDIDLVREKLPVRIKLDSHAGTTYHSTVVEIAKRELRATPTSLSNQAGGELATRTDPTTGLQRPMSTSYQARAPLVELDDKQLQIGLRGQAKIFTGWKSVGWRAWRYLANTFHFQL